MTSVVELLRRADSEDIRSDLREAHARAWQRLAAPGQWWTGGERVALAREMRQARDCALCRERKRALSPYAVPGEHESATTLPACVVEAVHRITTDPSRITRSWVEKLAGDGLGDAHYVELVGVISTVMSIDSFCIGIGAPLLPLPEPLPGSPSQRRPADTTDIGAFVPVLRRARGEYADLWDTPYAPGVIRALSLVPDEVRQLVDISAAQYYGPADVARPYYTGDRAITRAQAELLAGRVSAVNECFY